LHVVARPPLPLSANSGMTSIPQFSFLAARIVQNNLISIRNSKY
jgi:hypothetical protein